MLLVGCSSQSQSQSRSRFLPQTTQHQQSLSFSSLFPSRPVFFQNQTRNFQIVPLLLQMPVVVCFLPYLSRSLFCDLHLFNTHKFAHKVRSNCNYSIHNLNSNSNNNNSTKQMIMLTARAVNCSKRHRARDGSIVFHSIPSIYPPIYLSIDRGSTLVCLGSPRCNLVQFGCFSLATKAFTAYHL